jgi:hypothetical protein
VMANSTSRDQEMAASKGGASSIQQDHEGSPSQYPVVC